MDRGGSRFGSLVEETELLLPPPRPTPVVNPADKVLHLRVTWPVVPTEATREASIRERESDGAKVTAQQPCFAVMPNRFAAAPRGGWACHPVQHGRIQSSGGPRCPGWVSGLGFDAWAFGAVRDAVVLPVLIIISLTAVVRLAGPAGLAWSFICRDARDGVSDAVQPYRASRPPPSLSLSLR